MASKSKILTNEEAVAKVNAAVEQIKQTMDGLVRVPSTGAVHSHLAASLSDLKQALAVLVTRI